MNSKFKTKEHSSQGYDDDEDFDFEPETKSRRRASKKTSTGSHAVCPRVRHKWGTASYADLITSAILSTAEARLSLAEIYDWMSNNVPGLESQRYLHSSKGWKNAVRHTLSINPRFHKIVRMGRPSWWMVDVDSESVPSRLQQIVEGIQSNSSSLTNARGSSCTTMDEIYIDSCDTDIELELFRHRIGSEPVYSAPTLSLKRRNTVNLCDDNDDMSIVADKLCKYGGQFHHVIDTGVQKVKAFRDDGKAVIVTIATPIRLKTVTSEDCGTQTTEDDLNSSLSSNQTCTPTTRIDEDWPLNCDTSPLLPTCAAELAPSLSDSGFHTLTTLMNNNCMLDAADNAWEELRLDQSDLDAINQAFTTGWLTDENLQV